MEYSDGSDDTEIGVSISVGGDDLGSATYDSDGDGLADSVIVGQDEYTVVVTDADGDGEADSITAYDDEGNVVDSRQGPDTDVDGPDTDDPDTGDPGPDTGGGTDDPGTDEPGPGDPGGDPGTDTLGSEGTITVVDEQGNPVEVGEATIDWNNDGVPDTAVVQTDDGTTVGYTDVNGDGEADQITQITTDRQVTIAVADGRGGWEVVVTGHLDANGQLVEDAQPQTDGSAVEVPDAGEQSLTGDGGDATAAADGADGAETAGSAAGAIIYTDASGQTFELGEPTADFDGDGTPDTVVTTLDDGTVVGYSDVDGDGLTDQVTQIDPDGTVTIGVPDGSGGWEQAATGRIGADGEFVPAS